MKYLIIRILRHKSNTNSVIKRLAKNFLKEHPELFTEDSDYEVKDDENTDDEDDYNGVIFVSESGVKNASLNGDKNEETTEETKEETTKETQEEIKEEIKEMQEEIEETKEEIKEIHEEIGDDDDNKNDKNAHTPIWTFDKKQYEKLIDDIDKKFSSLSEEISKNKNDLIDGYIELRQNVKETNEKTNINDGSLKSRLENMEGKLEMLHGKQMEEINKPRYYAQKPKTKEDYLRKFLSSKTR